jgi:hypothetical protein
MNKPDTIEEVASFTQPDGAMYDPNTPPPWEPGEGFDAGWRWDKTIFGGWFERKPNLPYSCDPSFERYWCM